MHWLQKRFEALRARDPAGYRPGLTLGRVRRDFQDLHDEPIDARSVRFTAPGGGLTILARERTQSELLMHIVTTEFVLRTPSGHAGPVRIDVHHTGAWRRTGLRYASRRGTSAGVEALLITLHQDASLHAALMPLDFKRLRIERQTAEWVVTLEHIAGSEVVSRMPSFRRYIAFAPAQHDALLAVLSRLRDLLAQH